MITHLSPDTLQKMQREDEQIIAVDSSDTPLHPVEKFAAHRNPGELHRAVTVFLRNDQGEWLLTQRSSKKPLWPLWWDAACSTHPWWPDESTVSSCQRRLPFEIGVAAADVPDLADAFSYEYHAVYSSEWAENEINWILIGTYSGTVTPNPNEVAQYRWSSTAEIDAELTQPDHQFAPWFPLAWERVRAL